MDQQTTPALSDALAAEESRLRLQVVTHARVTGRTLTFDEAREVHELAERSLRRGKR